MVLLLEFGRAARAEPPPAARRDDVPSRRENVTQFFGACGWGTQGRTQFVARQRGMSASPVPISLVTFLFGNKKVTLFDSVIN